jgi:hypothetical protein
MIQQCYGTARQRRFRNRPHREVVAVAPCHLDMVHTLLFHGLNKLVADLVGHGKGWSSYGAIAGWTLPTRAPVAPNRTNQMTRRAGPECISTAAENVASTFRAGGASLSSSLTTALPSASAYNRAHLHLRILLREARPAFFKIPQIFLEHLPGSGRFRWQRRLSGTPR